MIEGPDGAWAVVMQTVWDTHSGCGRLRDRRVHRARTPPGVGQVLPGVGGTTRWVLIASDAGTASKVAAVTGLAG